jgi:hypothetical protein
VRQGVSDALSNVVSGVPSVLAALVVLLVGVVVGVVLKAIVVRVLSAIKLKPVTDAVGLHKVFPGKYDVAELVGDLVKWFFIVVFLMQALAIVHLDRVNDVVGRILSYVPNVVVAAVVVFVGVIVADLTGRVVTEAARVLGSAAARLLGDVAKYTIWAVAAFTALAQLGVNTLFLDRLFTAVVVMVALAGGVAFGLGGRDAAKDVVDGLRSSFKREKV